MDSLELFSGAGGLAKGLENVGVKHKAFVEWDANACRTLRANFSEGEIFHGDVRKYNFAKLDRVDIVAGGPPCQPFSLGGKHKGNEDDRDMFPHAIRAIRTLTPKAFVFENVKGLLRKSFASYFNYIILQLSYPEITQNKDESWIDHLARLEKLHTSGNYAGLKYNVVFRLINAADYGIPQRRERVFIVGIRDDLNIEWSFPHITHSESRLFWDKFVTGEYWDTHKVPASGREEITPEIKIKAEFLKSYHGIFIPDILPWKTVRDALHDLPDPKKGKYSEDHLYRDGARIYSGHTGSYIDEPSKTIKAGGNGVPGGENMIRFRDGSVRYFTVLETKRIQTFPDVFKVTGSWTEAMRQLGNAVPVQLAQLISDDLVKNVA